MGTFNSLDKCKTLTFSCKVITVIKKNIKSRLLKLIESCLMENIRPENLF